FPAEQHDLAVNFAGKVEQSDIEIFYLDTGGINLGQSVFHTRDGFFALRLAASHVDDIDQQAALQKHAVREFLEFSVNGLDQFLAVNGGAQQRLQHGQERLGFFESESSVGHMRYGSIVIHPGAGSLVVGIGRWPFVVGLRVEQVWVGLQSAELRSAAAVLTWCCPYAASASPAA